MAASGCTPAPEGAFEGPAGFSTDESAQSALAPATLTRDRGRLVTRALHAIEHHNPTATATHLPPLGAELGGHYDEGLRLVSSTNAAAFVEATPLGAAVHAPARLRHDGALVAYDGAYPGVSAAVGANDERVETTVRVPTAADAPPLRYRLRTGPAFGRWQGDDEGARWAYDREGRGLLRLAPPTARDANGRLVEGRWQSHEANGETVVEAELPWREMAFPAIASVAFETPAWYPAGGAAWPSPREGAGLTFYGGDQNCVVLFGGYNANDGPGTAYDDVAVRAEGTWQLGPGGAGIPAGVDKPSPRCCAGFAYAPFANPEHAGAYLFGGNGPASLSDLWKLVLHQAPDGQRSAVWTQVPTPQPQTADDWPSRRFSPGLAWTGTHLVLFGGVGPGGVLYDDTWRFDGTTWQRVCQGAGCFPQRRYFSVLSRGPATSPELLVFGGMSPTASPTAVTLTNQLLRFTGTGWQPVTNLVPATLPTLLDGRPSYQAGETAPFARFGAWAAESVGGQILLGSGLSEASLTESFWVLDDDDGYDAWRLAPRGPTQQWVRVPVTKTLPGRNLFASAVFDPVRQETLVFGGITDMTPTQNPDITYASGPPLVYRGRPGGTSMRITCHDPDGDGDCNSYTLEANVALAGDTTPSRARAVFLRQLGQAWVNVGVGCGTDEAPLAPGPDGVIRCEVTANFSDHGFAVQVRDGGYATGGTLCSPTPNESLPFCHEPNVYAGTVACTNLPFEDGDVTACPLASRIHTNSLSLFEYIE